MGALCSSSRADEERSSSSATQALNVNCQGTDGVDIGVKVSEANCAKNAYKAPAAPPDEEARMRALESLGVLDSEPNRALDDATRLCCMVFKVPVCRVSIVDSDRVWFKSAQGQLEREEPRSSSFSPWTLLQSSPSVLVVEDTLQDPRFCNHPQVVGHPYIRFYVGAPLTAPSGHRIGSICLLDHKPNRFPPELQGMLANFAVMVTQEIEKENMLEQEILQSQALSDERSRLVSAMNVVSGAIVLCDVAQPLWPIIFGNEAWQETTGMKVSSLKEGPPTLFWDNFQLAGGESKVRRSRENFTHAIANHQAFNVAVTSAPGRLSGSGSVHSSGMCLHFRPATAQTGDDAAIMCLSAPSPSGSVHRSSAAFVSEEQNAMVSCSYYYGTIVNNRSSVDSLMSGFRGSLDTGASLSLSIEHADAFQDVHLGSMLGHGSFGRVYSGQWNGTPIAIKVLEHLQMPDGGHVLEALLSTQVSHPNLVKTYRHCTRPMPMDTHGDSEQVLLETWMIMEFCNRGTLTDAVEKGWFHSQSPMLEVDYACLLSTAKDIASGMCYLHSMDILHGDLTGANILLATSNKDSRHFMAKVADFGFSRILASGDIKTLTHGAVTHTSPELLLDGLLSKAVDVYAFGSVMWEMYMGERPYKGLSHSQVINHISNKRGLRSLPSSCPVALRRLINRCTNPRYQERPTFEQVLTELDALVEELC